MYCTCTYTVFINRVILSSDDDLSMDSDSDTMEVEQDIKGHSKSNYLHLLSKSIAHVYFLNVSCFLKFISPCQCF